MKKLNTLAFFLLLLAPAVFAQEHYTEGPVWRVNYLSVKPGKFNDSLKDIREHFSKVWAEARAQGLVLDYKVFLNATSTGPTDWNIATAVLYKGYSALDGLTAKLDSITLKHYGSAEKRQAAAEHRNQFTTVVSSRLQRTIRYSRSVAGSN